jgi:galactokinase
MKANKIVAQLIGYFKTTFQQNPQLVFSPGRINLIGEHTDYNDGFAFPAAIDKGIYLAVEAAEDDTSTIVALDAEEEYRFSTHDTLQPLAKSGWENYILGIVAELQKKGVDLPNFNLVFKGDVPIGAGLSSSAALENAVVFGLNHLFQLGISRKEMIFISQKAEHHFAGVKCGILDQYASMFGQKNMGLHLDCRTLTSTAYPMDLGDYEWVLIHTNVHHNLADSAYNDRRVVCEKVAQQFGVAALRDLSVKDLKTMEDWLSPDDYDKAAFIIEENERTLQAVRALIDNDMQALGSLLFASHDGLSDKYKVSCAELDFLVDAAKTSDAVIGARMMGGGFGGCTLNLMHTDKKQRFLEDIQPSYRAKFQRECTIYSVNIGKGTHLITNYE